MPNALLFTAETAANGGELWLSDGTASGTVLLKDLQTGAIGSFPSLFTQLGNKVVFAAETTDNGAELWVTDGTAAGTVLLKDINPGAASSEINFNLSLATSGSHAVFLAKDAAFGLEYWATDGTAAGTVRITDFMPASPSISGSITVLGDKFFFETAHPTFGNEIWVSNGTVAGTQLLSDIRPGTASSNAISLGSANGHFFFTADDGVNGRELWSSTGTGATLLSIRAGAQPAAIANFANLGNKIVFTANDGVNGNELWVSDGTAAGTVLVENLNGGSANDALGSTIRMLGTAGSKAIFEYDDPVNGQELWVTDGTAAGTFKLIDIAAAGLPFMSEGISVGDRMVFTADSGVTGSEPWITDGTIAGTRSLGDLNPGFGSGVFNNPVRFGDFVVFRSLTDAEGFEPWIANVASGPAIRLKDIIPGAGDSFPSEFTVHDGKLYFSASGPNGREVWVTDGTEAGTVELKDIVPGTGGSFPSNFFSASFGGSSNTAPTDITLSATSVAEFRATGTLVGTLGAVDAQGGAMTYALLNSAGGRFKISGNQLQVDNGLLCDFEQNASHAIQVRVTDSGGLTFIKSFTITLTDVNPEVITGDAANNTFFGGALADRFDGGGGSDTLRGGLGNDTYDNVATGDVIVELLNQGYDTVNTALNSCTLGANLERVNFLGTGNFVGTGNALANRFQGGNGDDRFVDVLGGGDIFSGGIGNDTVDFRASAAGAVINMATLSHGGAAAGDSYSGIEKFLGSNTSADTMTGGGAGRWVFVGGGGGDTLTGGVKNDQLIGQGGNDTLVGGADRDSLDGGTGNDTMTGGAAGDVFVFIDAAFGQDTITDYQDGIDSFKIFSAVADNINDFTITNNGSNSVTLTLGANTITINGAAPITIAANDFVFF